MMRQGQQGNRWQNARRGHNILGEGSLGAFIVDQLSALGEVDARAMFGGAGFYCAGDFFGILFKDRLYFRVSDETVGEYQKRGMKPFEPFKNRRWVEAVLRSAGGRAREPGRTRAVGEASSRFRALSARA